MTVNNNKEENESTTVEDLQNKGVILLFDVINSKSSKKVIASLLQATSNLELPEITMIICSPGGGMEPGFAIIDTMMAISNTKPITTIAMGELCSMAPAIFLAGTKRFIGKHTNVLFHPPTHGVRDYVRFTRDRVKNAENIEKMYDKFVMSRMNMPKKVYEKAKVGELWLSAKESIKYGIAHSILNKIQLEKIKVAKKKRKQK